MNGTMKLEMEKVHPPPHNNNDDEEYEDDLNDDEASFFETLESSGLGANLEDELEKNRLHLQNIKKKLKQNKKKRDMKSWYQLKSESQRTKFQSPPSPPGGKADKTKPPYCYPPIPDDASPLLRKILEDERKIPKTNVCAMTLLFFVVLVVNILKGGGTTSSSNNENDDGDIHATTPPHMMTSYSPLGIKCNSPSFWILQISIILFILSVLLWAREYLLEKAHLKSMARYIYLESDIIWTPETTLLYPSICGCAGFFAGMFGIGGGIVKGPLMIAMGIQPAVASATSACMIFFTSFTATTSFVVFGLLIPDYGLFCFGLGFVSTLVGQTIMSCLLRRYQRNSYIAFSIGLVVLLSAICMTVESVVSIVGERRGESRSEFGDIDNSLCSSDF